MCYNRPSLASWGRLLYREEKENRVLIDKLTCKNAAFESDRRGIKSANYYYLYNVAPNGKHVLTIQGENGEEVSKTESDSEI